MILRFPTLGSDWKLARHFSWADDRALKYETGTKLRCLQIRCGLYYVSDRREVQL